MNDTSWRGVALPYKGYIGTCSCGGYGFIAVYSSIGYINHISHVSGKKRKQRIVTQK